MITDFLRILNHHGVASGLRRIIEEITENRMFDIFHNVETSKIVTDTEYFQLTDLRPDSGSMWYQPTYSTPLVKVLQHLKKNVLQDRKNVLFIDLGTGKGKPCIIASKQIPDCKLIGIDISEYLLAVCRNNLERIQNKNFHLYCEDVLDTDFRLLFSKEETIVIHNKNSFDQKITKKTLENILDSKREKDVYYIYNNPVYDEIFRDVELILKLTGWHKNHNINLYKI